MKITLLTTVTLAIILGVTGCDTKRKAGTPNVTPVTGKIKFEITKSNEVILELKRVLNAKLELAQGRKLTDGVILMTHGALAHYDMEIIANFRKLLNEKGYSTLAINLSLDIDNRRGMYDCKVTHSHQNIDAVYEIDVWVIWLKEQGVKNIVLLGHSRGGLQTALYAAEKDSDLIKAVVLMAPATQDNGATGYEKRYKNQLEPVLKKAQKLIKEEKGETVLEHVNMMFCRDVSATANAFVSYYRPDKRLDTPYLIPKIKKPILVLVAGEDQAVIGLDKKIETFVDGKRVQMKVIELADHFFRDIFANTSVDAIDGFLKKLGK